MITTAKNAIHKHYYVSFLPRQLLAHIHTKHFLQSTPSLSLSLSPAFFIYSRMMDGASLVVVVAFTTFQVLQLLVLLGIIVLVARTVQIYQQIQRGRSSPQGFASASSTTTTSSSSSTAIPPSSCCKTLVVLGSGGHTSEMLHMVRQLNPKRYHPIHYVVAATDTTSIQRLQATTATAATTSNDCQQKEFYVHIIPRSREVGQSYVTSFGTTLYALVHAIRIVFQIRPQLVLTNGPGTCVPIIAGCWILRLWYGSTTVPKMVFCESYCRVETLSLTGKILYPVVDCFLVHWDSLHKKCPKSVRLCTFVPKSSSSSSSSPSPTTTASKERGDKKRA